jgi:hypothetical protein
LAESPAHGHCKTSGQWQQPSERESRAKNPEEKKVKQKKQKKLESLFSSSASPVEGKKTPRGRTLERRNDAQTPHRAVRTPP